jgi:F-type H+-transporting ATPase subunit b
MRRYLAVLLLFVSVAFVHAPRVWAQEPASTAPSEARQTQGEASAEKKESVKEQENEDAEEGLKKSAAVRKVAGWLGIKDPVIAYWVFTILNFAILALALLAGWRKITPGLFKSRAVSIQQSIADARKASEEAQSRLSSIEGRLRQMDAEIASMRASSAQQAKAEEERLRASSEEEQKKIVQNAEQEIAAASAAAQRELKQFVAQLAVSLAEKKINVSESADRSLVRAFTQDLSSDGKGNA